MYYESSSDSLRIPFNIKLATENFDSSKNTMCILKGLMGGGKTYLTATEFLPTLFNNIGIDFAVYSVHMHEIMDSELFEMEMTKIGVLVTDNIPKAIRLSKKGKKVLLLTTHMSFAVSDKGESLVKYLKTSGKKFSIWIDEAHTWLVSGIGNYKAVMGSENKKYRAKMFNLLEELSDYSAYIFGITATPNREHTGEVKSYGKLKFEIINELPSKEIMIGKSAWYRNIETFDIKDETEIINSIRNFLIRMREDEIVTGTKKTLAVQCGRVNHSEGWDIQTVVELFSNIVRDEALWGFDDLIFAEMCGDERMIFSPSGKNKEKFSGKGLDADTEIKERLNDFTDPSRILFIVDKGKSGMNIFNLGGLISFRSYDKKNDKLEAVIESAIQILGRSVRLNVGRDIEDFKKDYGYELELYVKRVNDLTIEMLMRTNCFDILVPDIAMWGEALNEFKEHYASSVDDAREWINSIRGVCEHCGASSEHQTK